MKRLVFVLVLAFLCIPAIARAGVCCATCHEQVTCADCHAPETLAPSEPAQAPARAHAPRQHTAKRTGFRADGAYYVYVAHDMTESEAYAPGGLLERAEQIAGNADIIMVGPGDIIADDQ